MQSSASSAGQTGWDQVIKVLMFMDSVPGYRMIGKQDREKVFTRNSCRTRISSYIRNNKTENRPGNVGGLSLTDPYPFTMHVFQEASPFNRLLIGVSLAHCFSGSFAFPEFQLNVSAWLTARSQPVIN